MLASHGQQGVGGAAVCIGRTEVGTWCSGVNDWLTGIVVLAEAPGAESASSTAGGGLPVLVLLVCSTQHRVHGCVRCVGVLVPAQNSAGWCWRACNELASMDLGLGDKLSCHGQRMPTAPAYMAPCVHSYIRALIWSHLSA